MTIEEAINAMYFYREKLKNGIFKQYIKAFDMAISALRAQQTPLDRSRWEGCNYCKKYGIVRAAFDGWSYCNCCGRPLTAKAWAELERRIT